jgi:hypothetical protein
MISLKSPLLFALFLTIFAGLTVAQTKKVDFAKKIKEATPEALPQSPIAAKLKSDAQDNNLKGKVKSVIEYTQDAGKSKRELYSEEYYDEKGNFIKTVDYLQGYPESVTVWGYIDGDRVIKSNHIQYAEGERPPVEGIIMVMAQDNVKNPNIPKDARYDIKYTYKYNQQGQLVERGMYQNNGELWVRNVYNYKGNQREELHYDRDGSETSQTIEILDKNGNVIERHLMDADGKIGSKEINTYTFDSQGNWIVKKTFEPKKVKGKTVMKLLWTSYRTITYYQ